MQPVEWSNPAGIEAWIEQHVPGFHQLAPADQERLRGMARDLSDRALSPAFIASSLRSTADVLRELHEEETRPDNVLQREQVKRFIQENAVEPTTSGRY